MPIEIKKGIQLEIAHVLLIDIVGYSQLLIDGQRLKIDPVWDPIRHDPAFQELLTMKKHVGG